MIVTQLLILMGCLTGGTIVKSSDDATEVIQLWLNSHEGVEAVKFEFRHNYYDHIFSTYRETSGEAYYASPEECYFKFFPVETRLTKIRKYEKYYHPQKTRAEYWIWEKDEVIAVDEENKTFQRFSRFTELLGSQSFLSLRNDFPFTPMMTDMKILSDWNFELESEDKDDYKIKALPKNYMKKRFSSCDLIIQKSDMSLTAVRYSDPGNHSERVLIFSKVTPNPAKMLPFDDTGYSDISVVQNEIQRGVPAEFNLASAINSSFQLLVCFSKSSSGL